MLLLYVSVTCQLHKKHTDNKLDSKIIYVCYRVTVT